MRPSRDALKPCGVSSDPQMDLFHVYKGTQRLLYIYEVRATLIPSLNLGPSHGFWEQLRVRRICVHKRELWRLEQKNGLSRAWWTGSLTFSGPDSFIYWLLESQINRTFSLELLFQASKKRCFRSSLSGKNKKS